MNWYRRKVAAPRPPGKSYIDYWHDPRDASTVLWIVDRNFQFYSDNVNPQHYGDKKDIFGLGTTHSRIFRPVLGSILFQGRWNKKNGDPTGTVTLSPSWDMMVNRYESPSRASFFDTALERTKQILEEKFPGAYIIEFLN